jgi:uncharacterized damage-inducible protein DinB
MLTTFRNLVGHKGHANAALLTAVRHSEAASADAKLRALLHHILLANRFWLLAIVEEPFVPEVETRVPDSIDALAAAFRVTHDRETRWLDEAADPELLRTLESPLIPGERCSVADALMQVCLHSHGHRAQAAKMLRRLGGTPPATDYILWLKDRPLPAW